MMPELPEGLYSAIPVNIVDEQDGKSYIVVRSLDGSQILANPDLLKKLPDNEVAVQGATHLLIKGETMRDDENTPNDDSEFDPLMSHSQWVEAQKKLTEARLFSGKKSDYAVTPENTTSEELNDATTAPAENVEPSSWGEWAAMMNRQPLEHREAWFRGRQDSTRTASKCLMYDHERKLAHLEGQLAAWDKANDRLIKVIGDNLPLAGVEQDNEAVIELREWIEEYSRAMPGEEWFSKNIDGAEEEEILAFIEQMTEWYMAVMRPAVEADDGSPDFETLVYNMRFQFNPETQEFTKITDELNVWHTCSKCFGPIRYNDAPTGGWWSHAEHPHDNHDAEF